jgi:hypothetical protein
MNGKNNDITSKIDNLEKMVDTWQQTVQYNLTLSWTVLGVVLGLIVVVGGWALGVLAKSWAKSAAEKKIEEIKNEIKTEALKEINDRLKTYSFTITPGASIDIPYESLSEGIHPTVFVRTHEWGDKYEVFINQKKNTIRVANVNNEMKELPIDLLILKAKVKL